MYLLGVVSLVLNSAPGIVFNDMIIVVSGSIPFFYPREGKKNNYVPNYNMKCSLAICGW